MTSRPTKWDGPGGEVAFDYTVLFALDVGVSIRAPDQASTYDPADLSSMIDWLETEQMHWGIGHVILRTAELYASGLTAQAA